MMSDQTSLKMQRTWDTLARRNAMHYIATERSAWNRTEFLASGRETVNRILATVGHRPRGTVLDLGCGIGRLTLALADWCDHAIGVDVSAEMIGRARRLAGELGYQNVSFEHNNGLDLAGVSSGSCDLVFSHIVLQHVPERRIIRNYVLECGRVLQADGHAILGVPVYRDGAHVAAWRGVQAAFRSVLGPVEQLGLVDPERGLAFRGTRISEGDLERTLATAGLRVLSVDRTPSAYRYCDDAIVYAVKD